MQYLVGVNTKKVDAAFEALISKKGVEKTLEIDRNYLYQLRSKIKNGVEVSEATKLALLLKSGWQPHTAGGDAFSRLELVSFAKFVLKAGAKAKELGPEYLVEKWEATR